MQVSCCGRCCCVQHQFIKEIRKRTGNKSIALVTTGPIILRVTCCVGYTDPTFKKKKNPQNSKKSKYVLVWHRALCVSAIKRRSQFFFLDWKYRILTWVFSPSDSEKEKKKKNCQKKELLFQKRMYEVRYASESRSYVLINLYKQENAVDGCSEKKKFSRTRWLDRAAAGDTAGLNLFPKLHL
jgi:hypothetical protein